MAILKKHYKRTFTQLSNEIFELKEISMKARGILAYLMGKPDNWKPSIRAMADVSSDGRTAIASGMDELKKAGFVKYVYVQNEETGQMEGSEWLVADYPKWADHRKSENQPAGKSSRNNIEENNIELNNKEGAEKPDGVSESQPDQEEKKEKQTTWKNSGLTFEGFMETKKGQELQATGVDVLYYFQSIESWATNRGGRNKRRTYRGWVDTVVNAIRRENAEGKALKMIDNSAQNEAALEYLRT